MPKRKIEEVPLSPGYCLRNLQSFNEAVIDLYGFVEATLELMPEEVQKRLKEKIEAIQKFYRAGENS